MTGGTVIGRDSRIWHFALAGIAGALVLAAGLVASGSARAGLTDYSLESIGEFDNPVYVDDDGVNENLVFVVEQRGQVQVVRDGQPLDKPFLDLRDKVRFAGEQGLLSIAFDPDYAENRRFFVYYVHNNGNIRVDRFTAKKPTRAKTGSRHKVIIVDHPGADNHNGGQLQFGPDGYLYLAPGDGGGGQDPEDDAQRTDSLLGKLLRIAPKAKGGYKIPDGNPYADGPGKDEIYAVGLRNPFRFSFDAENGALTIGDVGQDEWEEVDYVADPQPGMNFGWNDFEGPDETAFGTGADASPVTDPVHAYEHVTGSYAVTGGVVVRDPELPSLTGQYLFADFYKSGVRSLVLPSGATGTAVDLDLGQITSFGEGAGNQVYISQISGEVGALEQSAP